MNARVTQLFPLLRPGPSPKVPVKPRMMSTTRTDPYPTLCLPPDWGFSTTNGCRDGAILYTRCSSCQVGSSDRSNRLATLLLLAFARVVSASLLIDLLRAAGDADRSGLLDLGPVLCGELGGHREFCGAEVAVGCEC